MSFPRYPKYKNSGVAWLGEVPEHWPCVPLWTCFRRVKRVGFEGEELLSVYRDYGVVPKSSRDDNFNKPSDDLSVYQLVVPGDLVINKMKAWQGSVAISGHRGIVSPAYFTYEAFHKANSRYLHYLMRSLRYVTGYLTVSKGIRVNQWDLEPQQHSRMPLLIPPAVEQTAITAFLDRETAKIDALIAEQQRLIELLQEERQAVISHAVTKGLNPDVPMKDSGIEWLDEMPKHWITSKPKYLTTKIVDGVHFRPEYVPEGIPFVTVQNLTAGDGISFDNLSYITTEAHEEYYRRANPERGDVLLTKDGATLGIARVIETDRVFSIFVSVALLKPMRDRLDPWFLRYAIESSVVFQQFKSGEQGSALKHIHLVDVRNVILLLPPLEEQQEIVRFLNACLGNLDSLVTEAQQAIDLLQERRSALISAAVMGQIDVRGLASSEAA